jgi:hypothetical protein
MVAVCAMSLSERKKANAYNLVWFAMHKVFWSIVKQKHVGNWDILRVLLNDL